MFIDFLIWDDEPGGNYWHIVGAGEVTAEEVEGVLRGHPGGPDDPDDYSASSGLPMIFGTTPGGKRIAVIYLDQSDDDTVIIYPVTAYPVPDYGG